MANSIFVTALVSLGTGVGGYSLKYYLDKRQNATTANAKFKRELYQEYVETIISFYSVSQPKTEAALKKRSENFRKSTEKFHNKFVLDASPGVIRAIKNLQQYNRRATEKGEGVYGRAGTIKSAKIFKQMRRDMGNPNWGLGPTASVMFGPILINSYERDMHPLWWSTKRIIYIKIAPFRWLRSIYIKLRNKFYSWTVTLELKPNKKDINSSVVGK